MLLLRAEGPLGAELEKGLRRRAPGLQSFRVSPSKSCLPSGGGGGGEWTKCPLQSR